VTGRNLLGDAIPPTLLPDDSEPRLALHHGKSAEEVAAGHPTASVAWAALAEGALVAGRPVESYAYARTGYHRGLDALRRSGWRGQGPVPWSHEPNQGFLRALAALSRAAAAIDEEPERARCAQFLLDCDPEAARALGFDPPGEDDE
jgi:hypothetical protein